jgi:hypothetical protein
VKNQRAVSTLDLIVPVGCGLQETAEIGITSKAEQINLGQGEQIQIVVRDRNLGTYEC